VKELEAVAKEREQREEAVAPGVMTAPLANGLNFVGGCLAMLLRTILYYKYYLHLTTG
jgi:hypothetical protein